MNKKIVLLLGCFVFLSLLFVLLHIPSSVEVVHVQEFEEEWQELSDAYPSSILTESEFESMNEEYQDLFDRETDFLRQQEKENRK